MPFWKRRKFNRVILLLAQPRLLLKILRTSSGRCHYAKVIMP